jgi:hypothetical protein
MAWRIFVLHADSFTSVRMLRRWSHTQDQLPVARVSSGQNPFVAQTFFSNAGSLRLVQHPQGRHIFVSSSSSIELWLRPSALSPLFLSSTSKPPSRTIPRSGRWTLLRISTSLHVRGLGSGVSKREVRQDGPSGFVGYGVLSL